MFQEVWKSPVRIATMMWQLRARVVRTVEIINGLEATYAAMMNAPETL